MAGFKLGSNYDQLRNRGIPINPFIHIGFVKRNDDAQRMGRLSIWIPELGGDPQDESSWVIASYASPFAGATDWTKIANYTSDTQVGQQSYGLWLIPPDLNNEVAVFFANGDITRAYWFACTYQQYMNHMVPGIAVGVTTEPQPPVHVSPVTEYNKADTSIDPSAPRRPPFHPLTDGLAAEGLNPDNERGPASTSARRESPSHVFGLLTPRGNTHHIDDNTENEFIRLRTRSGTQVLIHETTGYVYINSKNGNSWLEVSDAGVDIYSMNSVSVRAQQDLNVRADRDIFLDAGANISLRAGQKITLDAGGDINLASVGSMNANATKAINLQAGTDGNLNVTGALNLHSGGNTSLKAGGTQARDGSNIFDNCGSSVDAAQANAAVPQAKKALDTTQRSVSGSMTWVPSGGVVNTTVTRMPTHEPWPGHPNSKVPPPPTNDTVPVTNGSGGVIGNASNTNPDGSTTDNGCSFGQANTKPISTTNYNAIVAAADKVGVPVANMLAFGDIESSFQSGVGASTSSAKGLYQFTNGTWNSMVQQYGNLYNVSSDSNAIYDPYSNAVMGAQLMKNDTVTLQSNGLATSPGNLYMLHFLGATGGTNLIKAAQQNPDADASTMFPSAASANPNIFRGKTVGQVYSHLTNLTNSKANAYAAQQGLPPPCTRAGATGVQQAQNGTPAGPPTGAQSGVLAAAQTQLGNGPAAVDPYLKANGVALDATQENWCAAFLGASLNQAGIPGSGSMVANSYLTWGQPVTGNPASGDVVVQSNGYPPGAPGGHVGIATGVTRGSGDNLQYQMISGNYSNKVSTSWVNASAVSVRRSSAAQSLPST